jgi:hypothetical protein
MTVAASPAAFETVAVDDRIYVDIHDTASRVAALNECARDIAELFRMKRLSKRQVNEWTAALQLWGERRAGLSWAETSREIISGLRANGGDQ